MMETLKLLSFAAIALNGRAMLAANSAGTNLDRSLKRSQLREY